MLSISVLGPVEVRHTGRLITVPAGKTSEILVRLALDVGKPVRTDRLVDDLWGEESIHTSRNTVQSKIAKLRKAIGDPNVVVAVDGGYMLDVDPAEVDAIAVVVRANEAAVLLERGDQRAAAELCAATLEWFRGDVLAAAGEGDWVDQHRVRIEAARMQLLETGFAARLRLGEAGELIGELEATVVTYPYQESVWVLLISALYASGRQADVLAAYQRIRQRLADDLGLEPGPQLQRVEQQVLLQDASLEPTRAHIAPERAQLGNLPSLAAELIGRDSELTALSDLVASTRLVEIVGPGGIGKTAIAVALGRGHLASPSALRGGVWLARLETAFTSDDVNDTLLAALSVTGGEPALIERLRSSDALLILDNCEHVVEVAAELAVRLLDAAPGLRIVCTSQVPLEVDGETIFELEPLDLDDAIELFRRRATVQRKSTTNMDVGEALQELCRSLDGLPLAIELAAARTKTLSIEEITCRLDDRFNVLQDPTSRRPERRRALKATIRWSYELLFPDDQRALWALATFAGGAPLLAVESVLVALDVPATAAIDVLGRLASRSLVIADDDVVSGNVRYRLLDSIRAFALEAMAEAGLAQAALAAHANWYANAARSSTDGVRNRDQATHLGFAKTERANIDAALAWSTARNPLLALAIVNGFGWAWVVLGDSRGAQRLHAALAAAGDGAPVGERAAALLLAGWIEVSAGDIAVAERDVAAAAQLADTLNDGDLQARCCYYLAYVVSHRGEFRRAMELTDRSDALYAGLERPWDQAANWLFAAWAAISAGDRVRSAASTEQVERWVRMVDDPWLHVRRDAILGELARLEHRFVDAVADIGRAAETSHRLGFLQTEAYQTSSLGRVECQAGDYEAGSATLGSAIAKAEATGDIRLATLARVYLGRVLRGLGRFARAREVLEVASAWHRAAGGGEQASLGDCLLAVLDLADGVPGSQERLMAILESAQVNDEAHVEIFALDALARHAALRGNADEAQSLSARADSRMEAAAHFITERDRSDVPWELS